MVSIRKATPADEAGAFALLKGLGSSQTPGESLVYTPAAGDAYRRILCDETLGAVILAEDDGALVGVITLSYPVAIRCGGRYSCIEELIVSETMRGKGVGSRLLEAAVTEARQHGCFEVQVNNPSDIGYPLYIRAGMQDVGKHLKLRL